MGRGLKRPVRLALVMLFHVAAVVAAVVKQRCGGELELGHPALTGAAECVAYRRVCFDQGAVISFDPAFSPANATSLRLPRLNISRLAYNWAGPGGGGNTDRLRFPLSFYEPLPTRFSAGPLEASPDLRQPEFSNCTVPVVMWATWIHNFAEAFSHVVARVSALSSAGALPRGAALVLGTPAGERAPSYLPLLLRPFAADEAVSFGEFSARCSSSGGDAGDSGRLPRARHRCFQSAYLCAFSYGYYAGDYDAAQAVLAHYRPQLPPPPAEAWFGGGGEELLKVLIDRRRGPSRNLLNSAALVAECNRAGAWRGLLGGAGWASPVARVQCRQVTLGADSLANMAAVAGADVLVCVHGASCTNWLFMRPGSALLELRPPGFGSHGWADAHFAAIAEAVGFRVFWYGLNVEDAELSRASQLEAERPAPAGGPASLRQARDRHVRLPFAALRAMLLRAAAAGRRRGAHLAQRAAAQHYAELLPGGELRAAPARPAGGDAAGAAVALAGPGGSGEQWQRWAPVVAVGAAAAAAAAARMRGAAAAAAHGRRAALR